jgi:beta-glucanase (GH16 family)
MLLAQIGKVYHFVSGWVDSQCKVFYQFGKFEVVAKLPNTASQGIWPAHWLLPTCEHPCRSVPASCCWPVG